MACGAVPIVSPIETITGVFKKDENVLFARNLYPSEIAAEICRGMSDDQLAATIISNNQELVRKLADRNVIRQKVNDFYKKVLRKDD